MNRSKLYLSSILILALFTASSFIKKEAKATLGIRIKHAVGKRPLVLDTAHYTNKLNQDFVVTKFKYYLGQFELTSSKGKNFNHKGYFLVDEDLPESKLLKINGIEEGEYTGINFIIGVDSADNCSGAQGGALDPVKGMFWTWNTGYIFLKLEGKAGASPAPGHTFEYHVGGFRQPVNCIRKITFKFPAPVIFRGGKIQVFNLQADLLELLGNPNPINFKTLPSVTDAKNATLVADNFTNLFTLN